MPTREEILAAAKYEPMPLVVPEWGEEPIYLRRLSAKDQLSITEDVAPNEVPFKVLVGCICDADGNLVFKPGDEAALGEFPLPVVMRVFTEAARINGLSSGELEEAVSRFEPAQDEATSSE